MQNVAQGGDVVAVAEVRFQQIALDKIEAVANAKFPRDPFCRRNHPRPIDCGHAHARRFLGQRNSPNSRTRCEIDYPQSIFRFCDIQMFGKLLRGGVAHRNDCLHQLAKEFRPLGFLVHGDGGPSVAHDISQPQPARNHDRQNRTEESGERTRLVG